MPGVHPPYRVNDETFDAIRGAISGDQSVSEVFDELVEDYRPALEGMTNRRLMQVFASMALDESEEEVRRLYEGMSNEEIALRMEQNADALAELVEQKDREAKFIMDVTSMGFNKVITKVMGAIVKVVLL